MKRICITGATGYIGNRLARHLASEGHIVHALTRDPAKDHLLDYPGIRIFRGDLSDERSLEMAMDTCTSVYHVAAFVRAWHRDPQFFYKTNVVGTKHVLETARRTGIEKVVFTSTAGVFGSSENGGPTNEDEADASMRMATPYDASKQEAEQLVLAYCDKGLDVVITNPTRVYGPGIHTISNTWTYLIDQYRHGRFRFIPGTGRSIGNWTFIDDVVYGHVQAMAKGRPGQRYILGGDNSTFREFFEFVRMATDKFYRMVQIPAPLLVGFASVSEQWAKWTGRPPLITPAFARRSMQDCKRDCGKAARELGYRSVPLYEGIAKTVNWLKQQDHETEPQIQLQYSTR